MVIITQLSHGLLVTQNKQIINLVNATTYQCVNSLICDEEIVHARELKDGHLISYDDYNIKWWNTNTFKFNGTLNVVTNGYI